MRGTAVKREPAPSAEPARPELSVVIPAYNEAVRLPPTLVRIVEYLNDRGLSYEILVVDDGSRDETVTAALDGLAPLGARGRLIRQPRNMGKGAAVRAGMLAALGRRVLFTDADLSTPIEEIEKLERALAAGAEVAVGSRALDPSTIETHQSFGRELTGRIFNLLVRVFAVRGLRDTQCGFKLFTAEAARAIFRRTRIDRFGFDVEALALAQRQGLIMTEVPVRWANNPDTRVSLVQGAKAFLDPLRVRLLILRGAYDRELPRRLRPGLVSSVGAP